MRGLSEREKKILQLKRKQLSGYQIGRELNMDPPHVYRALKTGKKKLQKFVEDLRELGIASTELENFLTEVETEETKEKEPVLRAAF
jgi:DNA-binding transcriptional regulator YhcF (GntR family)